MPFFFSDALQTVSETATRNFIRLDNGNDITRVRKRIWVLQDRLIIARQEQLLSGRINVFEFLSSMCFRVHTSWAEETTDEDINNDLSALSSGNPDDMDAIAIQGNAAITKLNA